MSPVRAPVLLRTLQTWFADVVMDPSDFEDAIVRARGGEELGARSSTELARVLTAGPRQTAAERLHIYHRSYRARLLECLLDDYPVLNYAVGSDAFELLFLEYIAAHPSITPNLNSFGRHMATLCECRSEPWAPFAADVARLEWSVVEVIHAPTEQGVDESVLGQVPNHAWANARLTPIAALRLLELEYPVNHFLSEFHAGNEPEKPQRDRTHTLVYRRGTAVRRMDLSDSVATLLAHLSSGKPLGEALAALDATDEATSSLVTSTFRTWIAEGIFAQIVA